MLHMHDDMAALGVDGAVAGEVCYQTGVGCKARQNERGRGRHILGKRR